jgi:two-component system LytT family response regulator
MINAVIIDDELHCITTLVNDLNMFCPGVEVTGTFSSAKEGLLAIKRQAPDLLFLDIEMPVLNGFELLELYGKEITFQLIFTTAYENFATKAFRVSAIDYLLKPVDGNDLREAVAKAQRQLTQGSLLNQQAINLMDNNRLPAEQQKIAVPGKDGYDFIPVVDILYCEASGSYTRLVLTNDQTLLVSKPLGEIEALLPVSLFERIHHSSIINLAQVTQYKKTNGASVVMLNGDQLVVSRSKKDRLMQLLRIK